MEIILASGNKDKFRQLAIYFEQAGHVLVMPEKIIEIEENEATLQANAEKKALTYSAEYPGRYVLATDGGVKIVYLGDDWNHILTHRLSGRDKGQKMSERERCEMLLTMMKDAHGDDRLISWHEAYAVTKDGQILFSKEFFDEENDISVLLESIPPDFQETGFWLGYLWYEKKFGKHYMALTNEEKKSLDGRLSKLVRELEEKRVFV